MNQKIREKAHFDDEIFLYENGVYYYRGTPQGLKRRIEKSLKLKKAEQCDLTKLPFPKRSIPVQVGVRTPSLIIFELADYFNPIYSFLIKFHLISRGVLGEYLISFTPFYSLKTQLNLGFTLSFFQKKSISFKLINYGSGGKFNGKDSHCEA